MVNICNTKLLKESEIYLTIRICIRILSMAKPKPREAINTRLVDATKEYCYILSLVIIIFLIFL